VKALRHVCSRDASASSLIADIWTENCGLGLPPDPPVGLTLSVLPDNGGVKLEWSPPLTADDMNKPVRGYNIQRGRELLVQIGSQETSYIDAIVSNNRYYHYKVEAYNNMGTSSVEASIIVGEEGLENFHSDREDYISEDISDDYFSDNFDDYFGADDFDPEQYDFPPSPPIDSFPY